MPQITSNFTVCSITYQGQHQGNIKAMHHWLFGVHQWPVDSPHKGRVMWKVFHVIKSYRLLYISLEVPCFLKLHQSNSVVWSINSCQIINSVRLDRGPCHYLNQCGNIINWTLRKKLQRNFYQNSYIFIQENAFENIACETKSVLSQPQCVDSGRTFACFIAYLVADTLFANSLTTLHVRHQQTQCL